MLTEPNLIYSRTNKFDEDVRCSYMHKHPMLKSVFSIGHYTDCV